MNRQRAAQLRISPLSIQQGLFAVVALLITLIGGQQFLRWEQSQQPEAAIAPTLHLTQTHFSAVSSRSADAAPIRMMSVDQAEPGSGTLHQERWVF
ncbi:hypothetical protein BK659_20950 [Pseudomonas brassicacearum]|uniref:Uncharacterized protein n=1 Tax=Pseudomonas brassicacearum TaxID=930166 RepID=A0A423H1M0_9PSED|nr:hypothetical protein [Pseudomonas brassicacearum]RON05574.1 hypothetical protein BK659_20950 [Pseudomonas brassicacearum]